MASAARRQADCTARYRVRPGHPAILALAAALLCVVAVLPVRAQVVTGSYTGNGSDNRTISGLGFQPDVVIVKGNNAEIAVIRTSSMSGDTSKDLTGATAPAANRIQSFTSDGFTIGTDAQVNTNFTTYHWMAFKINSGDMTVGSYVGNGSSGRTVTGVGFSPELVFIFSGSTHEAVFRSSASSSTYYFDNSTVFGGVSSLDADGFTLGSGSRVNSNGTTYYYIAWNQVAGQFKTASYTGNGIDNRSITGMGFQPEIAMVKNTATSDWVCTHTQSQGDATDSTMHFAANTFQPNRIQQLEADGFEVGTNQDVNTNSTTYIYFAWAQQTAPTITNITDQTVNEDTATSAIGFTIGDGETSGSSLNLSGSSSNTTLVPNGNIVFGGSGTSRTVTVTPAANQSGTATITVTVDDGDLSAQDTFLVTVNAVNDAPTITAIADQETTIGVAVGPLAFTIDDAETSAGSLSVSGSSSNQTLVPDANVTFGGSGSSRTVTVTPASGQTGTATITVTVGDGTADAQETFDVTVYVVPPAGGMLTGSYTGNGSDNRAITGLGFQPDVVIIKGNTTQNPVIRTSTMGGDASKDMAAASALAANYIQSLDSDGFTIGTDARVNSNTVGYYWTAFKAASGRTRAGSYTGNGSSQSLTGLGFQPELVFVISASTAEAVFRLSGSTNSWEFAAGNNITTAITSLDTDGFTVGSSTRVNSNGVTYHWVAFNEVSGQTDVGSYSGNGSDNRNMTGVGFQPEYLFLKSFDTGGTYYTRQHPDSLGPSTDLTLYFDNLGAVSDNIQALQSDGFQLGASAGVNGSGITYGYFAWKQQTTPTISDIGNQTISEDTSTGALAVTVGDGETAAGSLTLSGTSSDTTLIPNGNIVFGGGGSSRTVTVTPAANLSGTATITVVVSDGVDSAYDTFTVTVNPVNDVPTLTDIASQSTDVGTATAAVPFTVGDVETAAGLLDVSGSSSNTTLVPNGNIVFGGSGANRTVTVTPAAGQTGSATITVTVGDGTDSAQDTFVLWVSSPTQGTQSGTATIGAGSSSTTAALTAVNMNRAFLVFSTTVNDSSPANTLVRGEITNPTLVTFTRYGTASTVTIKWTVVEYASGVAVQRGTDTSISWTSLDVTLSSVNTSKSVPLISYSQSGAAHGADDFIKAKLTSPTNLQMSRVSGNADTVLSWQVVEFTHSAVQAGDVSFLTTDSSKTATITSVDTSKSWLVYSHTSPDGAVANVGQKLVRGQVTNSTTLTFDRNNTGQTMDLTWYLVEFTDNHSVQKGSQAFTTTETQKDVTISSVTTSKSFALGGSLMREGRSAYSTDDNPGVGWMTHELTSSTNLRITRALTGSSTADMGWFVVTIPTPGITVTPTSGLTTTEPGGTATFTMVLTSQPVANVSIGLSSSDTTEGTVSPSSLTFTSANWSTAQTVTVTGADDYLDDGNVGYSVVTAAATSSDGGYSGLNASDVSVTTTDNDVSGFTVTPTSGLTTTEAGGTATFTVVLTAQPTANVTTAIASSDTTEGTVSTASLTFTSANWNTAQTVTLTGVNDDLDDGNVAYTVTTGAATSSDGNYNGVNPSDVSVSNTDNDTSGFTVTPTSGLTTTEAAGTATFTVVLTAQPTANVTTAIASSDTTEGTVSTASLTFTSANWSTAQTVTVTGANDSLDDGDVAYTITTGAATSGDGNYNGLNPSDVSVTNTDNDTSGITVSPTSGLTTTEAGGTATFTVVLDAQPTADVTVGIASSDTTEGTVSPASLTFTSGNWSTAQTVTVTGANDSLDDGDVAYTIGTAAATSSDGNYNGINPDDVSVTNTDNDTSGITVSPTSGLTTTEAGGTATFTVVLDAQPTADVTVGIASSDTTEGTVSAASVTFTSGNWNTAQTVTVTGANDSLDDDDVAYTVTTAAATSGDGNYNGINPSDVSLTNADNDTSGITVSPTSGLMTSEAGGTATFTVVLDAQPTADVTVGLASADTTEGTVSTASLTFTSANWNTAQTVTVTGANDSLDDGDVVYTVTTAAATSGDGNYNGINPSDVSVTNTDDDASGVTVTPTSGLTTTEAGATATFTVVLDAQPTADVTVGLASADTTEGTVSTASLTFTSANWNTAQTVTVTGADDSLDDGDVAYTVTTAAATSSDANYNGIDPSDVSVTNTDNDTSGTTVTPTSGLTTTEAGGTATFTVVLDAQPTADVTVGIVSADTTEGTVSTAALTFTSANWSTAQTVTVTGANDALDDGDVAYTVTTATATSGDGNYNGIDPSDVSVTNTDNDTSGITVTPTSGLTTTEAGGTATFTVVLDAQPTADVTVGLASADTTEGTVSTASLTFTSANWSTAQTVTVTGANDALDDGDVAYTVTTAAATSGDGNYNGIDPSDVSVTNTDNDVSGLTVTPTSGLTTSEAGGTATFTVVLDAQPTADVTVGLASADTTEGTISAASLTFTSANWSTAQTVTVTGANDDLDDGDVAYTVTTAAATSGDGNYNGINPSDVSVTNTDNDVSGFTVTPTSGLMTSEAGGTATFTVVLDAQPTADVTLGLASSDTTEGTVSAASLTFTSANWSTAQTVTVTGANDSLDDGDVAYTVTTAAATSSDGNYNGVNPSDVSLTNTDNDTSGITVSPTAGLTTTEAGGTATFTVVLDAQPTADVTVGLASSDTTEGTVSPASLTFTSGNWNTAQTVTVTGANDSLDDGDVAYTIGTAAATSSDGNYNGINPDDVSVTNTDNDTSGITVSPTSGLTTTEAGGTATFTVVLDAQPTADVTVGLASSDTTEGTVSPASLTFTSGNWDTAQTVTVIGADDVLDDGDIAYTVTTGAATSGDGNYNGINPSDVSVTNTDNDTSGFTVTPTSGLTTTEAGGTATFTVVATAQPTADVTVGIASSDTTEGTVSAVSLTFTSANWNTPQTVTVTGVDDDLDDGDAAYTATTAAATSGDGNYNGVNPDDVSVTNSDNDTSGFTVTPTTGLVTSEAGGTATFTVVLTAQPTADVTVGIASADTTEGTVSTASLTFTSANWSTAQTVTVTGANDDLDDGDVAYTVTTAASTSSDGNYNGINPADVSVTNTDNDASGITVTPTSGLTTTEAGGTATFTVVLDAQPTADVTVGIASSDTTEGTVSAASLTFTSANWNTAQTVTVTGANDSLDDGDVAYTVTTAAATSSDGNYNGINPADVSATNTDNDASGITVTPTSGLTTTEAGGTATFTVVLDAQPTADVTVGIASGDTTEGTVSAASLTFTAANWNTAQTVTVTGANDDLDDGDIAYTVTTAAATSSDGNYNGINAADVSVTNTDNDASGITVTPTSGLTTTEAGGTATFTVVLDAQPTADLTVGLASSDTTEGAVSAASLTFTSANWNTPQTVTVTGANDSLNDGDVAYTVTTAAATSSDGNYDGINPSDVSVSNTDDDVAGITVTPTSGLATGEDGDTTTFTVVLTSQPGDDVTVGLSSSDTNEGTVSPASLTFTSGNWNTPQTVTVTGVDDVVSDGPVAYTIVTAAATSTDGDYDGLNPADVAVLNVDNDTADVAVNPTSGLVTTEAGGTATFTVVLQTQPSDDVIITLSSTDTGEGTVSPASLTFTSVNWDTAQTVTVTGVNDAVDDGNQAYTIVLDAATSTDANYNGLDPDDVSVSNTDNDTAGILVSPTSGLTTTEAGGTATFTVVLTSEPTADVTTGVSSSDTSEGTVSAASLTFTSANWSTAQTVTVTGVDDTLDDGNQSYTVVMAAATSGDGTYNGVNPPDVSASNTDDDASGMTVTPTSGLMTSESGATATFTVVLNAEPTADVTIGLSSSDTTEGTVSPASLTFTSANWNTAQTVTATGVNDSLDDGDVAYSILTAAATSADGNYGGVNASDVSVTNTDDDASGITVAPTSGLTTTEAGGTATFTVVLDAQPAADVTVGIASGDTTEGTVSAATLTFTSANWNAAQTVTVTGVDDSLDDGDVAYTVTTAAATSADGGYNGLNASDVSLTNTDNDASGITVNPTSGLTTTEAGGTATFTVVLDAQPTADVTIGVSSTDTTEGTVSPASLTFTSANWNTAQTVTVTGADDSLDDGDVAYTVTTAAAASADGNYNGVNASDVSATNTDNDASGITVTPTSGLTTSEAGGTATFTVLLDAQPTADVTIGVSSSDTTEGTISPASIVFTGANWSTAQTVTVAGVDDSLADGAVAFTVVTAAATSADPQYAGLNAADVSASNSDDDAVGLTWTPVGGTITTEAGGTVQVAIQLNSQPTSDVSIPLSSNDTTEGTVSPSSVTFTSANWATPQTVTVTGVDDAIVDGTVSYTLVTSAASSADGGYNGFDGWDVALNNSDNDTAGVTVSPTSGLTTSEAGGTATFTVVLTAQPASDVSLALSSSDTSEGTVSPGSLTFTSGNWNTAQTVTVSGANDALADGNQSYSVVTDATTSADGNFNGINPSDVSVSNTDDDASGITVTPTSGLVTTEAGGTATFTVVLDAQPTADVTVGLSSSNTSEGTVSAASLTFTAANWNTAQTVTVTGVDDPLDDGNQSYAIVTAAAASADGNYAGVNATDVSVSNTDDDVSGITISPTSGLTTTEAGGTATFTVVLSAQPTADVSVGLSSSDTGEGTVAPASVTFTSANWNTAQTITVSGVDDPVDDGNQGYTIVTAAATSADPGYNGVNANDVSVSNTDDDSVGITVTPTAGLTTTEAGGTATFTVVLNAEPTADVTIGFSSTDASEGTPSPASLTFTSANWNTAQTVTVTGVDDDLDDGNLGYIITTGAATSADAGYNGLDASDVSATNTDNDASGITVTPTSGLTTSEAGATATFTIVLASQPTADVVIGLSSSNTAEGTVVPASLTFTDATWNTAQTVTVSGVDDFVDDGAVAYQAVTAAAVSADGAYNGLDAANVAVSNLDDDSAGISVTPTSGLVTTEAGGTATFTVVLTSQPTADVSLNLGSSDTTEGTASAASLTFTAGNWSTAQTVTVTGADDSQDDGNVVYSIITAAATSADPVFNGLNANDVAVTNTDDDTSGITVTPTSGLATSEAGGTATFTVVLDAQPTADVSLALSSTDTTEGTVAPVLLTFTSANWQTPQTVTVTGVDDALDDGDQVFTAVTGAASSADPTFQGLNAADVSVTTSDNDTSAITVTPTSGLVTTEAGGTATFTVVLDAQPTANVTMGLSSSDTTEGTVAPASLIFTSANWSTPQTVTVTGADDAADDGDQAYTIVTAAAVSLDANYQGVNASDVSVTTTDDDASGISVTPTSGLVTTEAGGTATFTVVLDAQPTADVTIGLSSSDTTEATVAPPSLTFTAADWQTAQTVTLTGVDDSQDDGNQPVTAVTAAAVSLDAFYQGLNAADVTASNTDDDTAGITVTPTSGLTTTEGGGTATFTVVLDTQPTADVTVGLSSSDTTAGTVAPASVTFTAANWQTAQTVTLTGVDDSLDDETQGYTIVTAAATSADPAYDGQNPADVAASTTDDDASGVTVTPTAGLTTTEGGGTATFTVVLTAQPTADVSIGLSSSQTSEGTVSAATLTFTSADWQTPQTVTVTGVDDTLDDGDKAYAVVTSTVSSADVNYNGMDPADVALTNSDDDASAITVTPTTGLATTEAGATATFTVVLAAQPTADVLIGLSSSDAAEGSVSPASVTFTGADWNSPQTVTVTGVDDSLDDGDQPYSVVTAPAVSADVLYSGLNPADVAVTNTDDDVSGITVNPTVGLTTAESGAVATFTVLLTAQPTADVTMTVSSSATGEGTVSAASLTFTAANWQTAQTVTVTGVDDAVVDGDQAFTVVMAAAVSSDPQYVGLDPADVSVTNADNDTAGILVSPTSGLETTDSGGTTTFIVFLASEPAADVTIPLSSTDVTEGTVSPASLTFTQADWGIAQTVTVTGVDDGIGATDDAYQVVVGTAVSTDPMYAAIDPDDVGVTNLHDPNDAPVWTAPATATVTEDQPMVFGAGTGNPIVLSDPDSGALPVHATVTVVNGTISLGSVAGLTFLVGDGSADASLSMTGTVAAVSAAFEGATFNPTQDFAGAAQVQLWADDQGAQGSRGAQTAAAVVSITVTAVNDAPTVTSLADQTVANDQVLGPLSFTVGDVDNDVATLTVTANSSDVAVIPSANLVIGGTGANRTVTITPAAGMTGPVTVTIEVGDGSETTQESFLVTVTSADVTISGVMTGSGGPLADVTLTLTGAADATTTSAADGSYSFANLAPNETYTVTASYAGLRFTPTDHVLTNATGSITASFQAVSLVTLGGSVRDLMDGPVAGVTVTLSGDESGTGTTDENGEYQFQVAEGGTYTVTPTRSGFTFAAPSTTQALATSDTAVNFTATSGVFRRYFSEGATSEFFDTQFGLLNGTNVAASVTLYFERADGVAVTHAVTIPAQSRVTVSPKVLAGLDRAEFSTVVESDQPVMADRLMTWDGSGYGSHAETGIVAPRTTWYLAEGATLNGFSLFYLLHNPNSQAAEVSIRYLLPAPQAPVVKSYTVPARTRLTIWVNQEDIRLAAAEMSGVVTSTNNVPIIVERAMYLDAQGQLFGAGHEGAGIPAPATQWFLAEGATGHYFDCFMLIANPSAQDAQVRALYLLPDGSTVTKEYLVAAGSRFNVWVDLEDPMLADTAVSTTVTSLNDVPIVVERSMWWPGGGDGWTEGHNSAGTTRSGTKWAIGEGQTGGERSTETYVLVANTAATPAQVSVSVMLDDGTRVDQTYEVLGNSRFTIPVGWFFPQAVGHRYGVVVESLGGSPAPIVVEYAMYSDAVEADGAHATWAAGSGALATRIR